MPTWSSHDPPAPGQLLAEHSANLQALGYADAIANFVRNALADYDESRLPRPSRALCLALGTLTRRHDTGMPLTSSYQLATFIALLKGFGIALSKTSIHDPGFSPTDKEFLRSLGMHVPRVPEEAISELDCNEPTLVFMPYLPYPVIELLYSRNWHPRKLGNLIMVNCRVRGWLDDDFWVHGQAGKAWVPCIRRSIPLFEVSQLPCFSDCCKRAAGPQHPGAFSGDFGLDRMCVQWIPPKRLAVMGEEFWRLSKRGDSEHAPILPGIRSTL